MYTAVPLFVQYCAVLCWADVGLGVGVGGCILNAHKDSHSCPICSNASIDCIVVQGIDWNIQLCMYILT